MKKRRAVRTAAAVSIVVACWVTTRPTIAQAEQEGDARLIGSWRLVSVATVRPNGDEVTDWMGPKPSGLLTYDPDGNMAVQIVHDPPAQWDHTSVDDASVEERAAAFDGYYAYFGRYDVDWERGIVRHFVERSLQPHESGIIYERRFSLHGDALSLTATPFKFRGEQRYNKLVWRRLESPRAGRQQNGNR